MIFRWGYGLAIILMMGFLGNVPIQAQSPQDCERFLYSAGGRYNDCINQTGTFTPQDVYQSNSSSSATGLDAGYSNLYAGNYQAAINAVESERYNLFYHVKAQAYLIRGWANHGLGNYSVALSDFNEAIRWDEPRVNDRAYVGRSSSANLGLGIVYYAQGDYDQAITYIQRDIGEQGAYEQANEALVYAYFMNGSLSDSLSTATSTITRFPNYQNLADIYFLRMRIYLAQGNTTSAIADANTLRGFTDWATVGYYWRGLAKIMQGDYVGALSDVNQRSTDTDPVSIAYDSLWRAVIYRLQGDVGKATSELTRAKEILPRLDSVTQNRVSGFIGVLDGSSTSATSAFNRAMSASFNDYPATSQVNDILYLTILAQLDPQGAGKATYDAYKRSAGISLSLPSRAFNHPSLTVSNTSLAGIPVDSPALLIGGGVVGVLVTGMVVRSVAVRRRKKRLANAYLSQPQYYNQFPPHQK